MVPGEHFQCPQAVPVPATQPTTRLNTELPSHTGTRARPSLSVNRTAEEPQVFKERSGLLFHCEVAEKREALWCSPAFLTYAAKNEPARVSHSPRQSPLMGRQETTNTISETPPLTETSVGNTSSLFS